MPEPSWLIKSSHIDKEGDELLEIIRTAPMPGLLSNPSCAKTAASVERWLSNQRLKNSLVAAALWLLAGELEASHAVSQSDESSDAAYWHGIMHRREGDFWNAKYWFRRAAGHPVIDALTQDLQSRYHQVELPTLSADELVEKKVLQGLMPQDARSTGKIPTTELPVRLTDAIQLAIDKKSSSIAPLQAIAWLEWQYLFHHCYLAKGNNGLKSPGM